MDLLFTNEEEMIEDLKSIPALGRSDHIGVTFRIVVSTSILAQTHEANRLNYQRADYTRMNEQFGAINWVDLFDSKSVQRMWDFFCVKYESVVRACTPAYNSNRHNKAPWYTAKVKKQCSKKKQMWSRYLSTGRFIDYKEYKEQNNKTIATIRDAKAGYEKKLIVNYKKRPKPFFKYMRSKQKTKTTVRNLKKENGDLTGNDTETANLLQKFFLSTFTHEDETTTPELPLKIVESQMEDLTITRQEVCNLMKSLKEDKSPGADNVHPKVLSRCHETLSHPLQLIFSQSLLEGKLPQQWKDANVTPLHKKGPKSEVGNYRPVSLTSIPCKLLETIIRSRIVQYLEQNNLLSPSQHGFISKRSCLSNLLVALEAITKAIDEGNVVDMIYFDYQKAFDTVPHHRLKVRLKALGFKGNMLKWIESFLHQRRQRVTINGVKSDWGSVTSGVPQGSVLGPILFILFVNSISEEVEGDILLFADDTKLYKIIDTDEDQLAMQEDINKLHRWSQAWLMTFNKEKCKTMHFGHNNGMQDYYMDGVKLSTIKEEKDLGVLITDDLKPSVQCTEAARKAMSALRWSRRSFKYIDSNTFKVLYKTYIRTNMEFCIQA